MKIMLNKALEAVLKALEAILKQKDPTEALTAFENFINRNGWPKSINKDQVCEGLDMFINEKLKQDPEDALLDTLLMINKKMPKITAAQRKMLKRIRQTIVSAKVNECDHKLQVSAFIHGGGFSPTYPRGEIICTECGLNVTISQGKEPKYGPSSIGISLTEANRDRLNKWIKKQFEGKKLLFAEEITKNPQKALEQSPKWPYKLPFKIKDMDKFESKSGV